MRRLYLLLVLLASIFSQAQTYSLMPNPRPQFFNLTTGKMCSGCKLYSYSAGTSTPLATYTDYTGGVQNPNPITLNASGQNPSGGIYLSNVAYKFVMYDSNNILQWSADNVSSWNNLSNVTLTNVTLTNPTINGGTLTGVNLINAVSVNETLTSPIINNPTISGTVTLNTPTITTPTITGGGSWAGSPTITTPTITGGTFSNPTITDPVVSLGLFTNPVLAGGTSYAQTLFTPIINGGVIDNTPIGKTIPRSGSFSDINLSGAKGLKTLQTDSNGNIIEATSGVAGPDQWVATGGCTANTTCTVTGTWPSAFSDANYFVTCTPTSFTTSGAFWYISAKTSSTFTITLTVVGATNPGGYNSFDCHGHHT